MNDMDWPSIVVTLWYYSTNTSTISIISIISIMCIYNGSLARHAATRTTSSNAGVSSKMFC